MATYRGNGDDNTINGSNNADDIFGKGGDDMLYGLLGDDFINGGGGDDFLFGGDGNDELFGGKGDDVMEGGLGADLFRGGKDMDTADYSAATSGVTVWLPSNTAAGYAAGDTFVKVENLVGTAFADSLQVADGGTGYGGAGNDVLYGGAALGSTADGGRLRGDAGVDTLSMSYGNTEAWLQNAQGFDVIQNFIEGEDMLFVDLSEFGLGNTLDVNEITNSNTITASGGHAQFIYEGDTGNLWFDQNGSGGGGLTLIAQFSGGSITGNDLGTNDFEYQV